MVGSSMYHGYGLQAFTPRTLLACFLLLGLLALGLAPARAGVLTNVDVTPADPFIGMKTVYMATFRAGTSGSVRNFELVFTADFDLSGVSVNDPVDSNIGPAKVTSISGSTVRATLDNSISVPAGRPLVLEVAGVGNPTTPGSYTVTVRTRTTTLVLIDSGTATVSITNMISGTLIVHGNILPDDTAHLHTLGDATHRWEALYLNSVIDSSDSLTIRTVGSATDVIVNVYYGTDTDVELRIGEGQITAGENLVPDTNTLTLGKSTSRWASLYLDSLIDSDGPLTIQTSTEAGASWIGIQTAGGTNQIDMNVGSDAGDVEMSLQSTDAFFRVNLKPVSALSGTLDLGSATERWNDLYLGSTIDSSGLLTIKTDATNAIDMNVGGDADIELKVGNDLVTADAHIIPESTGDNWNLGSASNRWEALYLGSIIDSDGVLTIRTVSPGDNVEVNVNYGTDTDVELTISTNKITAGENVVPDANTLTLGENTASGRWAALYMHSLIDSDDDLLITTASTKKITLDAGGGDDEIVVSSNLVTADANIIPESTADNWNLGSASNRWDTLFLGSTIDSSEDLTVQTAAGKVVKIDADTDLEIDLKVSGTEIEAGENVVPDVNTLTLGTSGKRWASLYLDSLIDSLGDLTVQAAGAGASRSILLQTLGADDFSGTITLLTANVATAANERIILNSAGGDDEIVVSSNLVTADANIIPESTADNWNLGSASNRWDTLYLGSTIDSFGSLLIKTDSANPIDLNVGGDGDIELRVGNDILTAAADILPDTTGVRDLGSTGQRWDDLYLASTIDASDNLLIITAASKSITLNAGGGAAEIVITAGDIDIPGGSIDAADVVTGLRTKYMTFFELGPLPDLATIEILGRDNAGDYFVPGTKIEIKRVWMFAKGDGTETVQVRLYIGSAGSFTATFDTGANSPSAAGDAYADTTATGDAVVDPASEGMRIVVIEGGISWWTAEIKELTIVIEYVDVD